MTPASEAPLDPVRLSKLLAFVLRHRPDAVEIALDPEGWTDVIVLTERLKVSGRLEAPLDPEGLLAFLAREQQRFEVREGRVRARGGHTASGVSVRKAVQVEPPDFLFFGAPRERIARNLGSNGLEGEPGRLLRLHESERAARRAALGGRRGRARVVVVEAQRAARAGVPFYRAEPGVLLAQSVPRRFLLSERPGFERQVSAGAVLVRSGADGSFDIALIRTRPRGEDDEPPHADVTISGEVPVPFIERRAERRREELPVDSTEELTPLLERPSPAAASPDAASLDAASLDEDSDERRAGDDRRKADLGPPGGVERRRKRRRRRGAWGVAGRMELPKGKLEVNESPYEAAVRELREETGLATAIELIRELPRVRYAFRTPEGKSVFKVVHYFLLLSRDPSPAFVPQGKEGIVAVEWTDLGHALETIAFGNLKPVLEAARDALASGARPAPPPPRDEPDVE